MERFDPAIQQCPLSYLCMCSVAALLVFLAALFLVG